MRTTLARASKLLGLMGLSFVLALLASEGLLRIAGISYPVFDDFDPLRGVRLKPGKEGWYRGEGEAYISVNSLGYRDREHATAKPEDTLRIAVLGDSMVEARQVPIESTFWSRLGKSLATCPGFSGATVEMLNFGISGYNTSQEFLTLQKDVFAFSPDIVLLAVLPSNDIEGNLRRTDEVDAWRMPAPVHKIVDGELVLDSSIDRSFLQKLLYTLVQHSRFFELVNEGRRRIRILSWKSNDDRSDDVEVGMNMAVFQPASSPDWIEAWRMTEALLTAMNDLTKRHGATFVAFTLPSAAEVDPIGSRRNLLKSKLGVDDFLYPDRRIAAIGVKASFAVHPLTKPLQQIADREKTYLHGFENTRLGFGHMNERGHQAVADLLAPKLCADGPATAMTEG